MPWVLRALLSPTWALADLLKRGRPEGGKLFLLRWHLTSFVGAVAACIALAFIPAARIPISWSTLLGVLAGSRCNEILQGFLADAFDQLKGVAVKTGFTPVERVAFAMRSYLEVIAEFAIIYLVLPSRFFKEPLKDIVQAIYFSGVTITTVGYGDIIPAHPICQLIALYEVLVGIVLVVVAFGTYVAQAGWGKPSG